MFNYFSYNYKEDDLNKFEICSFEHSKKTGKIKVTEVVDLSTGEILSLKEAKKQGVSVIYPDIMQIRQYKLDKLRKEVRAFAEFILKFRDRGCGFLVEFSTLIEWYKYYTNKTTFNIKRYIDPLIKAGVLDYSEGQTFLHKDFMINSKKMTKKEAKGNPFKAECIFSKILTKRRNE